MGITNVGKSGMSLLLSQSGTRPGTIAIGTGSGVVDASNVALINMTSRKVFTSTDVATPTETTFVADWNSLEMSGTQLTEFGVFISGTGTTVGRPWSREGFAAIEFDGTNELQIQVVYKII